MPRVLADWLYSEGYKFLAPESWRAFLEEQTRHSVQHARFFDEREMTLASALASTGSIDHALALVDRRRAVVQQGSVAAHRLLLLKARLLLRQPLQYSRTRRAAEILADLERALGAPSTVDQRRFLAEVHIVAAYAALRGYVGERSKVPRFADPLREGTQLALRRAVSAEAFASILGVRERAELQYLRARIAGSLAAHQQTPDAYQAEEEALGAALSMAEDIGDYHAVAELMARVASMRVVQHGLYLWRRPSLKVAPEYIVESIRWLEAAYAALRVAAPELRVVQDFTNLYIASCAMWLLSSTRYGDARVRTALAQKAGTSLRRLPLDPWGSTRRDLLRDLREIVKGSASRRE